jgi:hypothetical protein
VKDTVVGDDRKVARLLTRVLAEEGYAVDACGRGARADPYQFNARGAEPLIRQGPVEECRTKAVLVLLELSTPGGELAALFDPDAIWFSFCISRGSIGSGWSGSCATGVTRCRGVVRC